jgi:hypothetical protein
LISVVGKLANNESGASFNAAGTSKSDELIGAVSIPLSSTGAASSLLAFSVTAVADVLRKLELLQAVCMMIAPNPKSKLLCMTLAPKLFMCRLPSDPGREFEWKFAYVTPAFKS